MRAALIGAALAVSALAAAPSVRAQDSDPLAPAREGRIECISPNVAARLCGVMSGYRFLEDGKIANDYVMHIQNEPVVLAYGTDTVEVRDGMVCSRIEAGEIEAIRFTVDGRRAPSDIAEELRNAFALALTGIDEICSRTTPDGDTARVTVFTDGVEQPELAERMIWVRRQEGYTVGVARSNPT